MSENIIAVRNGKTIYREGNTAVKVFDEGYAKPDVLNEALNQSRVENIGINVPKILEVKMVDGKWAIVSEFIEGKTLAQLMQENPDKHFFFGDPCPCCLDMKKNTVEGILRVLEREDNAVFVDEALAARALLPLDRMLELAK